MNLRPYRTIKGLRRDLADANTAIDQIARELGEQKLLVGFLGSRCGARGADVGISSNAMVAHALRLGPPPAAADYPSDNADLARCESTYASAPMFLQERMLETLKMYRAHLAGAPPPTGPRVRRVH